jgi:Cytochrome C'
MRILRVKWFLCGLLALSLCLLAGKGSFSADETPEEKKAKAKAAAAAKVDVLDLIDGKGDAKAIAAKHTLESVMHGFQVRSKGGIGVGPAAVAGNPKNDGVEAKITALGGPKMTAAQLKMQEADLIKMLEVARTIGEINKNYSEEGKKNPAKWKQFTEDMIEGAKDAQAAVKKGDPAEVKKTITKLAASCTDCHAIFRD